CAPSPIVFFFSSSRRHTRCLSDWSSDVCSSDLVTKMIIDQALPRKDLTLLAWLVLALISLPMFTGLVSIALAYLKVTLAQSVMRSEERRVGKECRSRGGRWLGREKGWKCRSDRV